ncbi:amidohydrolase [Novosphingobium profundi]|uniref:amidohydrolase family protein n=1 Tax=Novosphingobium profundi TaxID=1774954 RepID=UPI001BD9D124|nr:amidohydrolase family protein [Novosphingobium profundi]MBT0670474.1 amidohydrolase [Novosphingobium profundi]
MVYGGPGPGQIPSHLPSPRILAADGQPQRTIDVHAHVMVPSIEQEVSGHPDRPDTPEQRVEAMGQASCDYNAQAMIPNCLPHLTDLEVRLRAMDAMGVDMQVLSPSPNQYHYWADPELSASIVDRLNTHVAECCAAHPQRLVGLGTVSLQHPELAVRQLDHAIDELGLKGIEISSMVGHRDLSDRTFEPFWKRADEKGAVLFLHPLGCPMGARLAPGYLSNHVGQGIEHAVAISHLIFGGVLDRHEGLKVVAAHGGGYLPTYIGRADHAWEERPDACTCRHRPSDYLKRMWFDSLVFQPQVLEALVRQVGASRVVVGTDYPFDMGHYDIHGLLMEARGLSMDDKRAILGENLATLLGL